MKLAFVCTVLLFKVIKDYWNEICPKFMIAIKLKKNIFTFLKSHEITSYTLKFLYL